MLSDIFGILDVGFMLSAFAGGFSFILGALHNQQRKNQNQKFPRNRALRSTRNFHRRVRVIHRNRRRAHQFNVFDVSFFLRFKTRGGLFLDHDFLFPAFKFNFQRARRRVHRRSSGYFAVDGARVDRGRACRPDFAREIFAENRGTAFYIRANICNNFSTFHRG